jgi:hypothetical protein
VWSGGGFGGLFAGCNCAGRGIGTGNDRDRVCGRRARAIAGAADPATVSALIAALAKIARQR